MFTPTSSSFFPVFFSHFRFIPACEKPSPSFFCSRIEYTAYLSQIEARVTTWHANTWSRGRICKLEAEWIKVRLGEILKKKKRLRQPPVSPYAILLKAKKKKKFYLPPFPFHINSIQSGSNGILPSQSKRANRGREEGTHKRAIKEMQQTGRKNHRPLGT